MVQSSCNCSYNVAQSVTIFNRLLKTFSTLRSDTGRSRWTTAIKYRAPHKPLLLLADIDLIFF